jgi:organic radical activating enzyme
MNVVDKEARTIAPVMEVFASIQGEGAYVGEPQVLLRLRGCPLRCRWCDTPASWTLRERDRARIAASSERHEPPWATPFQAACWIAEVEPGAPRTVSITGGEPLVWPEFLLGLRPMLRPRRMHLETAGAHPRALARVIDAFDHVSLDLKPELDLDEPVELEAHASSGFDESSPITPAEWRAAREACLTLVSGRDACGKIVVSGERTAEDFLPLFDEIERCAPKLAIYLQPATPVGRSTAPRSDLVASVCEMARDRDLVVRVVPQVHRFLGVD